MVGDIFKQSPSLVRQSLKTGTDDLPEPVFFTVFEFLSFEKRRFLTGTPGNDIQEITRKKAAFERLKKYSGSIHLEKHWKEELNEALDEKYNRPHWHQYRA